MRRVDLKPLSVNECWQGKRFKTKKYRDYEVILRNRLPELKLPKPPYSVYYEFGFSSASCDLDNPIKPFQDVLQKVYGFNDKDIFEMVAKRAKVKKGNEYIVFDIKTCEE